MKKPLPQTLWIITAVTGAAIIAGSILGTVLIFILPQAAEGTLALILVSLGFVGLLLGLGLLWAGWSGWQRLPAPQIYTRWGWAACLVLIIMLVGIAFLIPEDWQQHPIFAPFHLGLAALPAFFLLTLIALTAGRYRALTFRELIAALSGGATSIVMALPVEIVGFVISAIVVALVTLMLPGGTAEINRMGALIEHWRLMPPTDTGQMVEAIASPVVLVILFLVFVVIAPVVEEIGKTLVMGVMGVWRRPGLTQAFIWGAACGLGFAIVESITNGASSLGEVWGWLGGMGARAFAAAMHMLTSGIIGLGWGFFWRKRRWVLPLTYAIGILFHGLWNLNTVITIAGTAIGTATSSVGFVIATIGTGLIIILALFAPLALISIPVLLRAYESRTE
ncbi:MAG: PrsW family intramembrane metalloprotease [Anaerolineae bacterium]|nr:PrsW family intramembrane metalloprotease [Anaerolineae bacterium]